MEDLLSKIYDRVAYHEAYSAELDREYDRLVDEKLGRFRECMAEDDVERISELVYELSYHVRKHGFLLGMRFMAGLLSEAIPFPMYIAANYDKLNDASVLLYPNLLRDFAERIGLTLNPVEIIKEK